MLARRSLFVGLVPTKETLRTVSLFAADGSFATALVDVGRMRDIRRACRHQRVIVWLLTLHLVPVFVIKDSLYITGDGMNRRL